MAMVLDQQMRSCAAIITLFCSMIVSAYSYSAPNVLVLGDSLSAGYGINPNQGWVALMESKLKEEDSSASVTNGSISGETSAGGLSRLPALLTQSQPNIVIIELGANDGLRGYPLAAMKKNLTTAIRQSKETGAKVLLLGVHIPPNYGARYTAQFFQTYAQVADKESVALVPFFLEGVATNKTLMQQDGLHPNAEAQPYILQNIWPKMESLVESLE